MRPRTASSRARAERQVVGVRRSFPCVAVHDGAPDTYVCHGGFDHPGRLRMVSEDFPVPQARLGKLAAQTLSDEGI